MSYEFALSNKKIIKHS